MNPDEIAHALREPGLSVYVEQTEFSIVGVDADQSGDHLDFTLRDADAGNEVQWRVATREIADLTAGELSKARVRTVARELIERDFLLSGPSPGPGNPRIDLPPAGQTPDPDPADPPPDPDPDPA